MNERFKIYAEQLRDGRIEEIHESYNPEFIAVDEAELQFKQPVSVAGQAYLADENLVLHLQVETMALMPCVICNGPVQVDVQIDSLYHVEPLAEIKGGIFYLQDLLREAILLELPKFAECQAGHCPARKNIEKFLKSSSESSASTTAELDGEGYRPFADIDFDIKPKT